MSLLRSTRPNGPLDPGATASRRLLDQAASTISRAGSVVIPLGGIGSAPRRDRQVAHGLSRSGRRKLMVQPWRELIRRMSRQCGDLVDKRGMISADRSVYSFDAVAKHPAVLPSLGRSDVAPQP
jgi:hypothetical protein